MHWSTYTGWTQKSNPPATFVDISVESAYFCMKFYVTVKQSNLHFITKFGWNVSENDKIMLFQPRQPPFRTVRALRRTDWMRTGSLRRLNGPQALQIWTHWTITPGAPCWESTINSSRNIRRLMSWNRLADHWEEMPREHVNRAVAIFTKCLTAYVAVAANSGHSEHLHSALQ